jgi:hypothetical protein
MKKDKEITELKKQIKDLKEQVDYMGEQLRPASTSLEEYIGNVFSYLAERNEKQVNTKGTQGYHMYSNNKGNRVLLIVEEDVKRNT